MKSAEHWLVHEHTQFEVLFRQLHDAADILDWWAIDQIFLKLVEQLRYHMAQEEEVLFPAYDARYDTVDISSKISTAELCDEHSVIIEKFRQLEECMKSKQSECVISIIVSLEMLMLFHNEKEEKIFLPFASHLLFDDRDQLSQRLDEFIVTDSSRNWEIKILH